MEERGQREAASLTQKQFGHRARAYAASTLHSRDQSLDLLERLAIGNLAVKPGPHYQNALDVGCGAGFTAVAISWFAGRVMATDLTPEMVQQTHRLAQQQGAQGVDAAIANASSLPLHTGSMELVTCRYAFHHMPHIEAVLEELRRVLREGGVLLLADTVAPEDTTAAQWMNNVEVRRDPSHLLNRTPAQLLALLESCSFQVTHVEKARVHLDLASWTHRSGTSPRDVDSLREDFLAAGPEVKEAFEIVDTGQSIDFSWPCLVVRSVVAARD